MILYTVLAELDDVLSESKTLMDMYQAKELSFFVQVQRWLEKLEQLAEDNKWPFQSAVSGLRGQLVTASRMQNEDSFSWMPRSKNRRRAREALAAEVVKQAVELAEYYVAKDWAQQEEASNILR